MTQIPLKEYLILEARKLGIKPHALDARIRRGKAKIPPVVREWGKRKRIKLVICFSPEHSKWVKHSELVLAALDAVRAVYADQTVDKEQVQESLREIKEQIEILQGQIPN